MNGLWRSAVLATALVGLAACGTYTNVFDGKEYRVLAAWPLLCHADGSVIIAQKENLAGGFTDAVETSQPCAPIPLKTDIRRFTPEEGPGVDAPEADAPDGFFGGGGFFGGDGFF